MDVRRYTALCFVGVGTKHISESVRCCSFSEKRNTTWFMQTNNQTHLRHTSSNKPKRAASCYIVQQDMKCLLSSRLCKALPIFI